MYKEQILLGNGKNEGMEGSVLNRKKLQCNLGTHTDCLKKNMFGEPRAKVA